MYLYTLQMYLENAKAANESVKSFVLERQDKNPVCRRKHKTSVLTMETRHEADSLNS